MRLPLQRTGTPAPARQQRDPAADQARTERAQLTEQWLHTAMRPDLAAPPVQRKPSHASQEGAQTKTEGEELWCETEGGYTAAAGDPSEAAVMAAAGVTGLGVLTTMAILPAMQFAGASALGQDEPAVPAKEPRQADIQPEAAPGHSQGHDEPKESTAAGKGNATEIAQAIAAIKVIERKQAVLSLQPWRLFERVPKNFPAKKRAFNELNAARDALRAAREQVHKAERAGNQKAIELAQKQFEKQAHRAAGAAEKLKKLIVAQVWMGDEMVQLHSKEERRLTKRLAELEKPRALKSGTSLPEDAETAAQVEKLRKRLEVLAAEKTALYKEAEAYAASLNYEETPIEGSIYTVVIDGEIISLRDHIEAYPTVFTRGFDGGAARETTPRETRRTGQQSTVVARLEASGFSGSIKKILKTISENEGGFTTVNTYDRAVITWGFMQWTGGEDSDLTRTLTVINQVSPEAFERRFRRYGIDVQRGKLVIMQPSGKRIVGKEAALLMGQDPVLSAVLARAGLDEEIQDGQIEAAVRQKIDGVRGRAVEVSVGKFKGLEGKVKTRKTPRRGVVGRLPITIGEIVTSEYGIGVLCDHAVHGGEGGAADAVGIGVEQYLLKNAMDPLQPSSWAGAIEPQLWNHIVAGWTDRASKLLENGASQEPGSFQR